MKQLIPLLIFQWICISTWAQQLPFKELFATLPSTVAPYTLKVTPQEFRSVPRLNSVNQALFTNLIHPITIDGLQKLFPSMRIHYSDAFQGIVYKYQDGKGNCYATLVHIDAHGNFIDQKLVASYFTESNSIQQGQATYLDRQLKLSLKKEGHTHYQSFLVAPDGHFHSKKFFTTEALLLANQLEDERIVSAKGGLNIRDKLGNKIGKLTYGTPVQIKSYSSNSKTYYDNGVPITGRTVEIILDFHNYLDHLIVPEIQYQTGFVFEGYLFARGQHQSTLNHYLQELDESPEALYKTYMLNIKKKEYCEVPIDIKEFITLKKLKQLPNSISNQKVTNDPQFSKKTSKTISLIYGNGTSRILKDTMYTNSEYQPVREFRKVEKHAFLPNYLIFESFFEDYFYFLLNEENGDTLHVFEEYPHCSPNLQTVVCLKTPLSYDKGTALVEVCRIDNGKIEMLFTAEFTQWNLPNEHEVYWVSDRSFIIKAKQVEDAFSNEENASYFYLQFTLQARP